MVDFENYKTSQLVQSGAGIDEGLRSYMLKVYNLMAVALLLTGFCAYSAFSFSMGSNGEFTSFGNLIYASPFKWLIIFAPIALVFFMSVKIQSLSVSSAQTMFYVYSGLMGLSLSTIFLIYTGQSITQTFFITASAFGALSLFGYTTKRDLTGLGSFLIMGLFGILIAAVVNIFLQSSALQFAISSIGVLVFSGLTAYDTQKIKEMYFEDDDSSISAKKAILGALALYLDFINLFIHLLYFLGRRD